MLKSCSKSLVHFAPRSTHTLDLLCPSISQRISTHNPDLTLNTIQHDRGLCPFVVFAHAIRVGQINITEYLATRAHYRHACQMYSTGLDATAVKDCHAGRLALIALHIILAKRLTFKLLHLCAASWLESAHARWLLRTLPLEEEICDTLASRNFHLFIRIDSDTLTSIN